MTGVQTCALPISLSAVESGDAEAGVVFKTDAAISKKVKVAYEVPAGDVHRIAYPACVLKGTRDVKAAGDFLAYLESKEGLAVFKKFRFITRGTP